MSLWLLVILWGNEDRQRYYLVAFPENRSGPKAEIHEVHPSTSGLLLGWRYAPRKGDGRNPERVALFEKTMGSAVAYFDATLKRKDLTAFLDDVFFAIRSRLLADDLQAGRPKRRGQPGKSEGFPEGRVIERWHHARERASKAVAQAKRRALAEHGRLACACCAFDFQETYGEVGVGFIEAHHAVPLSTLGPEGATTRPEDLVLVCSNCHRMLHRRRPWLTAGTIQKLVRRKKHL
ncbi:HNH endonuclease [Tahibacter soli]|uniref:HNH endonuclease n=1 Tax=Tahibacter soli TaxID=2983605 RepID=A0A9X3YGG4_9GAMM|nr:HNH endonuclease [Tahibacter soli]MDC8010952.1 HNH endonuclease [Tahibacter soli]